MCVNHILWLLKLIFIIMFVSPFLFTIQNGIWKQTHRIFFISNTLTIYTCVCVHLFMTETLRFSQIDNLNIGDSDHFLKLLLPIPAQNQRNQHQNQSVSTNYNTTDDNNPNFKNKKQNCVQNTTSLTKKKKRTKNNH